VKHNAVQSRKANVSILLTRHEKHFVLTTLADRQILSDVNNI